jgi:hypothetical protein
MLIVIYAECRYDEYRYAECHGTCEVTILCYNSQINIEEGLHRLN